MVNGAQDSARAAERVLALGYAPADRRRGLDVLFALDDRLGDITMRARDPTIGLMRLTWWGEALGALDRAPAPAEPLLRALAADVLPLGIGGAVLERLVDGWARLLEPEPVDLDAYAGERGGALFTAAAAVLGGGDERVAIAGEAWALTGLARARPIIADAARVMAARRLSRCFDRPWPRALRPLGALALLARYDAAERVAPGDPRRVGRLLWHRLTGR